MKFRLTKIVYLIVFFVTGCNLLKAQDHISYAQVDSATYSQYILGNWDALIKTGNEALNANIDYYYLRMRIAYALFQKKQYRKAIPHYQQALHFNNLDLYALSYLAYSYEYSGRRYDALALSKKIDSVQLPELYKKYHKAMIAAGVFYNYNKGFSEDAQKAIGLNNLATDNGIQKTTIDYFNIASLLTHRIGKNIVINHTLTFLKKHDHNFVSDQGILYEQPNLAFNQWNYNGQMQITLSKGFRITPVLNYVNVSIPFDMSGGEKYTDASVLYGAITNKDFKLFNLGFSYTQGQVNHINQNQYAAHLAFYPKANLNLYYQFDGYYQKQKSGHLSNEHFIYKHLVGFRLSDYWWAEASGTFPYFTIFYETTTGILYNGLEKTKNILNLKNIFFIKNSKLSIIINTGIYDSVSEFVPNDNFFNRQNSNSYSNINFSGGILWKL